ncbi:hypothetical protein DAEQUDRAFT_762040 [Daedalea quercina L-15889]|uniref:Uncharacterized protein n=1 Tax=Daedalea quercina L-15889 TaxID=1314783 RepID=A0A165TL03_9APHY|nr:hypothetical protein DAEQUDRAFT_762040 [Daedalea quercina L-15889]
MINPTSRSTGEAERLRVSPGLKPTWPMSSPRPSHVPAFRTLLEHAGPGADPSPATEPRHHLLPALRDATGVQKPDPLDRDTLELRVFAFNVAHPLSSQSLSAAGVPNSRRTHRRSGRKVLCDAPADMGAAAVCRIKLSFGSRHIRKQKEIDA